MKTTRLLLALPVIGLAAVALSGCLAKQQLDITYYSFSAAPIKANIDKAKFGNLFVRDLYVDPNYETKNFTYRTGDLTYEQDFYNQLALSPRSEFSSLIRTTLRDSGLFASVIMPESSQRPDNVLEGDITKFFVDFREGKAPRALLSINFMLYGYTADGTNRQILLSKLYEQSVPLPERSAPEVAKAWNSAYNNIMRRLVADIKKLPDPAPVPEVKPADNPPPKPPRKRWSDDPPSNN